LDRGVLALVVVASIFLGIEEVASGEGIFLELVGGRTDVVGAVFGTAAAGTLAADVLGWGVGEEGLLLEKGEEVVVVAAHKD
jgi:hypothetical protein